MRARWLAAGLALVLGGVTMAWFAQETEPVAYDWPAVMDEEGYAHYQRLARGYPASALPPEQQEHCPVRIVALRGGAGLDRRMTEMGLNIGAQVQVLQQQGGGLVVMRGESRFALGGGMAHRVMVTPA